jgi:hypothetical protein
MAPHRVVEEPVRSTLHRSRHAPGNPARRDGVQSHAGHKTRFKGIHIHIADKHGPLMASTVLFLHNVARQLCALEGLALISPIQLT